MQRTCRWDSPLPRHSSDEVEKWILELAWAFEDIDAEQVRKEINADRKESGFQIVNLSHIKAEIDRLQKYYLRVMTSVLKNLLIKNALRPLQR